MTPVRQLLAVAACLSVCGQTFAAPTTGQPMSIQEAAEIVQAVSEPYQRNLQKVANFMEDASGKMLDFLEQTPSILDEVHQAMEESIESGMAKVNRGRLLLQQADQTTGHIIDRLHQMREECTSGQYQLTEHDGAEAEPHESHAGPSHFAESLPDLVPHEGSEKLADLLISESDLQSLLQPTQGIDEIIESIVADVGADSYVTLKDVLTIMQSVGQQFEQATLDKLPTRLERMNTASADLMEISHHVEGISQTVDTLSSLASQSSNAVIESVGSKVEIIAGVLSNVECME